MQVCEHDQGERVIDLVERQATLVLRHCGQVDQAQHHVVACCSGRATRRGVFVEPGPLEHDHGTGRAEVATDAPHDLAVHGLPVPQDHQIRMLLWDERSLAVGTLRGPTDAVRPVHLLWGCEFRYLSLIHISEPTRLGMISYAVFCLKKKK